jgi:hypothetical protein
MAAALMETIKMKLYEKKILVNTDAEGWKRLDDEQLEDLCNEIDWIVEQAEDRISDLLQELSLDRGIKLKMLID